MKLWQYLIQVLRYTETHFPNSAFNAEAMLDRLEVVSDSNPHLSNHRRYQDAVEKGGEKVSILPLDAHEEIAGQYFVIDYGWHTPFFRLIECASHDDLERYLLSDAGLLNPFTTFVLAFVHGELKEYTLFYHNPGRPEYQFHKAQEDAEEGNVFHKTYARRRLKWVES